VEISPVAGQLPDVRAAHLADILRAYRNYKALGDAAIAQVADADLHAVLDPDANSIAVIVKHLGGNLRSRFTDFLTSDGEKPDRDRDEEFEVSPDTSRAQILDWWEAGWSTALASIEALAPDDLTRTVYIRGEAFLVTEALTRSVTHTAYHVGQIVLLAKHLVGPAWKTLSIPKGQSARDARGSYKQGIVRNRELGNRVIG
jgi:hypothetical protein